MITSSNPTTLALGFIGFGEAAFHIAKGLVGAGLTPIRTFDVMAHDAKVGPLIAERASEAKVELEPSLCDLMAHCDIILCATSAKYALSIAKDAVKSLRPGSIYADLNSASPGTKKQIGLLIEPTGALFADVAVMELVPPHGHKVPLAVSGSGAKKFQERLSPYGMKISFINEHAGSSSALKMLRSIFMKGLTSLLLETLTAGRKAGVDKEIMDSISGTINGRPLADTATMLITRTAIAAERRIAEMGEVLDTLQEMGLDSSASAATKVKLQALADLDLRTEFGNTPPETYTAVLDAILRKSSH
ncbi:MAG: NAD(P)-dependent oxidoreductase [Spirochaetae bacterium HGW-Spirochaetae-9]|nr:MAG: NAD(P)-dependent oxidoreductase [Spirochaetae bacterium HGW-Spirochaetae-9]